MRKLMIGATVAASLLVAVPGAAQARTMHWCRQFNPQIYASAQTPCGMAVPVVTAYYNLSHGNIAGGRDYGRRRFTMNVTYRHHWYYPLRVVRRGGHRTWGGTVTVSGPSGIWMRFSGDI